MKEIKTKYKCPFCKGRITVRPWEDGLWSGPDYTPVIKFQVGCSTKRCPLELPAVKFETEEKALSFAKHLGETTKENKHERKRK